MPCLAHIRSHWGVVSLYHKQMVLLPTRGTERQRHSQTDWQSSTRQFVQIHVHRQMKIRSRSRACLVSSKRIEADRTTPSMVLLRLVVFEVFRKNKMCTFRAWDTHDFSTIVAIPTN